jgi:HAD superfamily hydrolase (TIGR01509 family)
MVNPIPADSGSLPVGLALVTAASVYRRQEALAAVLFDLDGTLIASDDLWDEAVAELADGYGERLPPDFAARSVGIATAEAIAIAYDFWGMRHERIRADLRWVSERVRILLLEKPPPWLPGARELVREVGAAGLRTGLVTSSERKHVEAALTDEDRARFDVIVCADDVTALKPDPEPYRHAASRLGLRASECAVVEDSAAGVASALAAGCQPVVVVSAAHAPADGAYPIDTGIAGVGVTLLRSLGAAGPAAARR